MVHNFFYPHFSIHPLVSGPRFTDTDTTLILPHSRRVGRFEENREQHNYNELQKSLEFSQTKIDKLTKSNFDLTLQAVVSPGRTLRYEGRETTATSSETQGQIVGVKESLNGRKNKARRKVQNGEKSPWGQCLTRLVPTTRSPQFWLLIGARKLVFFLHQSEARTAATV